MTNNLINIALTVLILCTLFYLYVQWNNDVDSPPLVSDKSQQEHDLPLFPTVDMTKVRDLDDYKPITDRPLFHSDRRPLAIKQAEPEKKVEKVQTSAKPVAHIVLNAVIITDDTRIALLQTKTDKTATRVFLGDHFAGWILKEVNSHSVVLESDDESKLIELETVSSEKNKAGPSIGFPPDKKIVPQDKSQPVPERPGSKLQAKTLQLSPAYTYVL